SAMLAHEFRNLLTPIVSYAHYALQKPDADLMKTALETTLKNARAAAALCERVTGMAADEETTGPANIRTVVDDAIACLGRGLDRDAITLDMQVPADLTVQMNPNELQQVMFNLILNARQAMLDRPGTLTIAAQRLPDNRVEIRISDTGT